MNYKVLTISDDKSSMKVFINTNNKLAVDIQYGEDMDGYFGGTVELEKEDVSELIKELKNFIKFL